MTQQNNLSGHERSISFLKNILKDREALAEMMRGAADLGNATIFELNGRVWAAITRGYNAVGYVSIRISEGRGFISLGAPVCGYEEASFELFLGEVETIREIAFENALLFAATLEPMY